MRKIVAALGLLIAWSTPALAGGLEDARVCFQGTQEPTPEYLPYCTRAIESGRLGQADLAMTHNNRGAILQVLGRGDAALADYDRALRLNPRLSLSYLSRGMIRIGRGDRRGGWEDFNKAIESAPRDSRGYVNRGMVYLENNQPVAALKDFNRALKVNPEDPLAYNNRATLYHRQGDQDRAYADSKKAIAFGIDEMIARGLVRPGIYHLRVSINIARGRYKQAIADLDTVLRLRDDIPDVHNDRAWLLATVPQADLRNGKEAVRSARIAIELADIPAYRNTLAAAYAEAGAFDKAIAEQQRAIEMLGESGETDSITAYQQALSEYRQGQPRRMDNADG